MALGGALLKTTQTLLRILQFLAAAVILGIFSYFLAVQQHEGLPKPAWVKAVEGISGAAMLYTILAILLTCFIGGLTFSVILAILLDILFAGAFAAVAVYTRGGTRSCSGQVYTPIGNGNAKTGNGISFSGLRSNNKVTYQPNLGRACRLEKASFAVAIILVILFLITILFEVALRQHHRKEKRYGPSPKNNYTAGTGRRRFGFGRRRGGATRDAELGAVGAGGLAAEKHHHVRPSGDTAVTGTTMAGGDPAYAGGNKYGNGQAYGANGYNQPANHHATAVNPSGHAGHANF